MKLIDLLVQELPKRGGWPEGVKRLNQGYDGEIEDFRDDGDSYGLPGKLKLPLTENHRFECQFVCECQADFVTREQYEAALQKPEWNGEGMPPVGCECEAFDGISWYPAVVVSHYDGFAFAWNYDHRITFTVNEIDSRNFRPIRNEAEQKREDTKNAIAELCRASASNGHSADLIYDAIAAGKIPGITLK